MADTVSAADSPEIMWQQCLGGSNDDEAYSVQQTNDGGYIVAGYAMSNDGDVTDYHHGGDYIGRGDVWVVKLDSTGSSVWQRCLGGLSTDSATSVQQTSDDGYIVAGIVGSNDGDVTDYHGTGDVWVVKLDSTGSIVWQRCLGGTDWDKAMSVQQTSDGGYIVAGSTMSNDGDVTDYLGYYDAWVVKLDSTGSIVWQRCLGGTDRDEANSVQQTSDGGYIVAGGTNSNDGDVTDNHGDHDAWVVKLDNEGSIVWQRCLGGSAIEFAHSVQQTSDDGYIVAGQTMSLDGDVTDYHGSGDVWVVKLDSTGSIVWQRCLGGKDRDEAYSVQQTSDGGYIVAGYTTSNDGDVTGNEAGSGGWVVKLDSSGSIVWQRCLGEFARSVQHTSDGGTIVAGSTRSNDGDVTGNHGGLDAWVVKFAPELSQATEPSQAAEPSQEAPGFTHYLTVMSLAAAGGIGYLRRK